MRSPQLPLHDHAESLYREHHAWLAGWLRYRMGGEEAAADLAQDTFLRVLLAQGTPVLAQPRAYLATIARRLLANHHRHVAIERAYLDALAALPPAFAPSPEARKEILETLCAIDRALDTLPAKVREAFLLAQLEGMKYEDIARRLGVTPRTVGNYMERAVQACFFAQVGD
ncbi:sigma-70 family RNA polymerase sigma factor [Bordetella genomosp. 13]|uniref:sigma-70 family RNA polymerase sigma factor n=1 Tax=Bordetella genomosp. 13 TaxID=463040 RepID=UPI0011A969D8|nr:sigma-70 family RNA polymerase sigma factor [Bordetella genomosp. 13]